MRVVLDRRTTNSHLTATAITEVGRKGAWRVETFSYVSSSKDNEI